jgi:hypothetical protein
MVGAGMTHEFIIIRTCADTFDVIVGHRLNDRPLSRAEADPVAAAGDEAGRRFHPHAQLSPVRTGMISGQGSGPPPYPIERSNFCAV